VCLLQPAPASSRWQGLTVADVGRWDATLWTSGLATGPAQNAFEGVTRRGLLLRDDPKGSCNGPKGSTHHCVRKERT